MNDERDEEDREISEDLRRMDGKHKR